MHRVLSALIAATATAVWFQPAHGLGRPGLTPVACPSQEWEIPDAALEALPGAKAYSGRYDGVQALFLKDVYELLERVVDRCRDAGNVITHIVLKNA